MANHSTPNLITNTFKKMFAENKRFDGRKLDEFRDFEVSFDVSNKAEGSARVKLGKTEVIAGVKLEVGVPYPDSPNKGNLMVAGELLPIASPDFESGPPQFDDIEIPRLIDRAVRESGMIDLSKLVITPGEKVWTIIIDVYPINDDGNLIDASTIAAIAALQKAHMPNLDKDGKVNYKEKTKTPLPINKEITPISISISKLGSTLILDPTREEEAVCESRISWGISKSAKRYLLNSCQKREATPLTSDEIIKMMELVPEKYNEISEKLKKFL